MRHLFKLTIIPLILFFWQYSTARPVPDEIRNAYSGISAERLEAHLSFLASEELEGRGGDHVLPTAG